MATHGPSAGSGHGAGHEPSQPGLYGLMAEFDTPTAVITAARRARKAGYTALDGFSPYPVEELMAALKLHRTRLPWLVFLGGVVGFSAGMGLEVWASAIAYPMNIGGRPFVSLPSFIIPAYETTILFAALTAVVGMIALNGLPRPYHPVFNVPQFERASIDRFFLLIEARDPQFDAVATRRFLEELKPLGVADVAD
jgi:Protein of unknown function (DUF3341)